MSEAIPSRLTFICKSNRHGHAWYRCVCGKEKEIQKGNVKSGNTRSCGCFNSESSRRRFTKHGHSPEGNWTPEYAVWCGMKTRCSNPRVKGYAHYGGRGIRVCDRWQGLNGFANFLADMGLRPSPKHSIDRIDNNGPYNSENCRWATVKQQARNTQKIRNVTYNGRTQRDVEWAEELGIGITTLRYRLRHGWSVVEAFTKPVQGKANS